MLDDVFFVSMEGRTNFVINDFVVREDVPLPVLADNEKAFSASDINPENIILGMIKVVKDDPENENLDYYRDFIYTVKPDVDEMLTSSAYEAENNGDYSDALDIYRGLLALNPDSQDHLLNIAVCYDEFSQVLLNKGRELESEKMDDLAFEYFKKLEGIEPKEETTLFYLGRFYFVRENYEKALDFFNSFVVIASDEERKNEVIAVLKEIQEKGVFDGDYKSAYDLIQADKDEDALGYIERFLGKYPHVWTAHYLKGHALRKIERFNDSVIALKEALKYNESSADVFNELGLCYTNLESFTKAELAFVKALRDKPEDVSIMYNLAILFYKKEELDEACRFCQVILDMVPEDLKAKELLDIITKK